MNVQRIERGSLVIFWAEIVGDSENFNALEFEAILNEEEREKLQNLSSKKRQLEFANVRLLWKKIGESEPIMYRGRIPYLQSGRAISISHTNTHVGLALGLSGRLGFDIEPISRRVLNLAPRFLNKSERDFHRHLTELQAAQIWSFKEVAYKYFSDYELAFIDDISILWNEKSRYWAEIRLENTIFELPLAAEMFDDYLISFNAGDARKKTEIT